MIYTPRMEETKTEENRGLSGNALKFIAITAMTIDHLTWAFFPGTDRTWYVMLLHIIGRLTAPIMWFFIAEGCHYTRNRSRYLLRLFLFALVSHFAYCFAFGISYLPLGLFNRTSVMWSLAIAASLIFLLEKDLNPALRVAVIVLANVLSFPSDWSSIAVMAPVFLYYHRGDFIRQSIDIVFWTSLYALVYFLFLDRVYGALQMFTFLSLFFLRFYNGRRGSWKGMKWFFYIYYPVHLLLVGLVRLALQGDVSIIF